MARPRVGRNMGSCSSGARVSGGCWRSRRAIRTTRDRSRSARFNLVSGGLKTVGIERFKNRVVVADFAALSRIVALELVEK